MPIPKISSAFLALAAALTFAACGAGGSSENRVALVAYSTPQEVYAELIAKYQAKSDVYFTQSFGASGDQSRAVANGLPGDVVNFAYEPDMTRLVEAGKVAPDWDDNEARGMITNSVVVFAVREGNPKQIKDWQDLTRPGVDVIAANPIVSGGARWNIVAAYGQALAAGKSPEQALAYVKSLIGNVSVQDKSARESLLTFSQGKGDVLITYENEAITAKDKGQELDYVIPPTTLLVENPIAVAEASENKQLAEAFLAFLAGTEGQKIFAEHGYRPIDKQAAEEFGFPTPKRLLTANELGGWEKLNKQLFDDETGAVTKINEELGVGDAR